MLEINKPKSKALIISTWYRPPSANIELLDYINNFLQKVDDEDKDIIITGDFNCNFLASDYNEHTNKLNDLMNINCNKSLRTQQG